MKCQCGSPMQQRVIALDDIWWSCVICGRTKQAVVENTLNYEVSTQKHEPAGWAKAVIESRKKTIAPGTIAQRRPVMSKNLSNLNEALFEQLDRLAKAEGDGLKNEIERTRALSGLANTIVENAKLVLEAHRTVGGKANTPKLLGESE